MVKSGAAAAGLFVTRDATGALAAAGTGPAGTLYVNGTANGTSVTISGANPYKWSVTLPSLTAGDCVSMYITATIDTIATGAVVWEEVADTVRGSDLATAAELAKVPKSDGSVIWNLTALAAINAEVDTALNTAIPGSPTADSINQRVAAIDDLTQAGGAGDLAAMTSNLNVISPTTDASDSFTQAAGTVIAGTYVNTQTDDANSHTLAPANPGGLDATYVFECGTNRAPIAVTLNGYWNGSGQTCDVYAYDYDLGIWDKLTNTSTRLVSRSNETNYSFPLNREHMDVATNPGNVSIRFVSASTNTAHRLYIDRLLVSTVSAATGQGPTLTAQDVWQYAARTLTSSSGDAATPQDIAAAVLDEAKGAHTGLIAKALPDAAPDAAGGLPISDAGGLDMDAILSGINAISAIKRATALSNLTFLMTLNRAPVTGATVTSYIRKDAGAFGATTNSVAEIANGLYAISLTATEMTATVVTLRFTASGCDDLVITLPVGS